VIMRFILLSALVVALQCASTKAQSSLSTSTSSSKPSVQTIYVARGDHTFNKNSVNASIGDTIVFEFYDNGHSVIQAEYGYPCTPYGTVNPLRPGFYSQNMSIIEGAPTVGLPCIRCLPHLLTHNSYPHIILLSRIRARYSTTVARLVRVMNRR
jgi:hypothetical protein